MWKGTTTITAVEDLQNDGLQTYKVGYGYIYNARFNKFDGLTVESNNFTVEDTSLIAHRWSPNDGVAVHASNSRCIFNFWIT